MLIIGLIILAAPVLSVYMDKAGTAMFFIVAKLMVIKIERPGSSDAF